MQQKILQTCKKITEALSRAGLSRPDFARLAGITEASVSRYLSGKTEPRSAELGRMAAVLGVSTDWLLGLTDDSRPIAPSSVLREDPRPMPPSRADTDDLRAEVDRLRATLRRIRALTSEVDD